LHHSLSDEEEWKESSSFTGYNKSVFRYEYDDISASVSLF
jgi:hypothetical protein